MLSVQYDAGLSVSNQKMGSVTMVWSSLVQCYLLLRIFITLLPCGLGMGLYDGRLALQSGLTVKRLGILNAFTRSLEMVSPAGEGQDGCGRSSSLPNARSVTSGPNLQGSRAGIFAWGYLSTV